MICCSTAATHPSRQTPYFQMYSQGEIEAELVPQDALVKRLEGPSRRAVNHANGWVNQDFLR